MISSPRRLVRYASSKQLCRYVGGGWFHILLPETESDRRYQRRVEGIAQGYLDAALMITRHYPELDPDDAYMEHVAALIRTANPLPATGYLRFVKIEVSHVAE